MATVDHSGELAKLSTGKGVDWFEDKFACLFLSDACDYPIRKTEKQIRVPKTLIFEMLMLEWQANGDSRRGNYSLSEGFQQAADQHIYCRPSSRVNATLAN